MCWMMQRPNQFGEKLEKSSTLWQLSWYGHVHSRKDWADHLVSRMPNKRKQKREMKKKRNKWRRQHGIYNDRFPLLKKDGKWQKRENRHIKETKKRERDEERRITNEMAGKTGEMNNLRRTSRDKKQQIKEEKGERRESIQKMRSQKQTEWNGCIKILHLLILIVFTSSSPSASLPLPIGNQRLCAQTDTAPDDSIHSPQTNCLRAETWKQTNKTKEKEERKDRGRELKERKEKCVRCWDTKHKKCSKCA